MNIELLYFDGCPSWKTGLVNLKAALTAENIDANIHLVRVESNEAAAQEKFLGSPSFRIDNQDLWPVQRQDYYLDCRVYRTDEGIRGFPSVMMLRTKIQEFLSKNTIVLS
jgi:hypothetical protein